MNVRWLSAALTAGLVTGAYALPKQEVAAVQPRGCVTVEVVNAYYCPTCREVTAVPTDPQHPKDAAGHDLQPRECCKKVKKVDRVHPGVEWLVMAPPPEDHKNCDSEEKAVLSPTTYRCDACDATSDDVSKFRHKKPECRGTPYKSCKDSGRLPHIAPVV